MSEPRLESVDLAWFGFYRKLQSTFSLNLLRENPLSIVVLRIDFFISEKNEMLYLRECNHGYYK